MPKGEQREAGQQLSCDLRYALEDAVFAVPAARLGLGDRLEGIQALLHRLGPSRTRESFFTARRYNAGEALGMGLVDRAFLEKRPPRFRGQ